MEKLFTKAFTLIELIVVIAVLGILAVIVVPNISSFQSEAKVTAVESNVHNLQTGVDMYALENYGRFPATEEPTETNPQPIDYSVLHPDFLRNIPKTEGVNYWVDYKGKVWSSYIDSPTNVSNNSGTITWTAVDGADGYNVYAVQDGSTAAISNKNLKWVAKVETNTYTGDISKEYAISTIDKKGFESAPAGTDYVGMKNNAPTAVITINPAQGFYDTNTIFDWSSIESTDPNLDKIVDAEWQNNLSTYSAGTHTVKLRVKDERGLWSEWTETTISVDNSNQYTGTVWNFTNAGQIGRFGPSQAQLNNAYSGTTLAGSVTSSNGIQLWTVPESGTYRIETYGAEGGSYNGFFGGKGVIMKGNFTLSQGEQIKVLVGQQGEPRSGGGGTFVTNSVNNPLIVSGGGAGANNASGFNAVTTYNDTNGGILNGDAVYGSSGAGFNGNGNIVNGAVQTPAYSFVNGGQGASGYNTTGGFGGGGSSHNSCSGSCGGGGGGGYEGGDYNGNQGWGGGSYNSGLNQENSTGYSGQGKVIISKIN